LTNGADRTVPDLRGNLPLHMTALWGQLHSSMLLLEFGDPSQREAARGTISAPNNSGLTPLHLAVWGRHPSSVAFLLGHGADLTARALSQRVPDIVPCHTGTTPLHLAATRGHIAIAKEILKSYVREDEVDVKGSVGQGAHTHAHTHLSWGLKMHIPQGERQAGLQCLLWAPFLARALPFFSRAMQILISVPPRSNFFLLLSLKW
jgi:ankyrin repeat protein